MDERTGEFLGGLVIFRDVTTYTNIISHQNAQNEKQFEVIANTIPVMVWTSRPDGHVDYLSDRWIDYTGMSEAKSTGDGWANALWHEDAPRAAELWMNSMASGEEYVAEYRCKSSKGGYRWLLGRAVPLRDDDGKIVKW